MSRGKTRRCSDCQVPIWADSTSGLCQAHYAERETRRKNELDARIIALATEGLTSREITERLGCKIRRVSAALQGNRPVRVPQVRLADVVLQAARLAGLTSAHLKAKRGPRALAHARQAACLLGMEAGFSSPQVGRYLGGRDHSTIVSNRQAAVARVVREAAYAQYVDNIRAALRGEHVPTPEPMIIELAAPRPSRPEQVAPVMRAKPPLPRLLAQPRVVRPRNDFLVAENAGEDEGHRFQRGIAEGSRRLAIAILAARAT